MTTMMTPTGGAPAEPRPQALETETTAVGRVRRGLTNPVASVVAILVGVLWTIPTVGLLVQSFRDKHAQDSSGWWTFSGLTVDNYHRVLSGGRSIVSNLV